MTENRSGEMTKGFASDLGKSLERPHLWRQARSGSAEDVFGAKTFLLLHGVGADEFDLLNLGKALDANANLLSVRGLVTEGGNRHFMRFADGSFDQAGVIKAADDLAAFLTVAAEKYGFNPATVWAVGFSNGANMSGSLLTLHPESVAGIVAFATNRALDTKGLAPNLEGKQVFIANGSNDGYSPAHVVQSMVQEFTDWGADVNYQLHRGGHMIIGDHVELIRDLLARA
jgi:phospholipase/carboxylesterase